MKLVVFGDNHDDTDGFEQIPVLDCKYLHLGDLCHSDANAARRSIDTIREMGSYCVLGSHDKPVVDDDALFRWKEMAEQMEATGNKRRASLFARFFDNACRLRESLEAEYLDFVRNLPETVEINLDGMRIRAVHDALVKVGNCRILTTEYAAVNLDIDGFDILFHGHTHTPSMFAKTEETAEIREKFFKPDEEPAQIASGRKYLLNPGSLSRTRGYPSVNAGSVLFPDRPSENEPAIVTFDYGSYGVLDTIDQTFEVVFFEK
jgi:predicted phosphodiesterase